MQEQSGSANATYTEVFSRSGNVRYTALDGPTSNQCGWDVVYGFCTAARMSRNFSYMAHFLNSFPTFESSNIRETLMFLDKVFQYLHWTQQLCTAGCHLITVHSHVQFREICIHFRLRGGRRLSVLLNISYWGLHSFCWVYNFHNISCTLVYNVYYFNFTAHEGCAA